MRLDETGEVDLRGAGAGRERERAESVMRIVKAVLYAVQVFYSFFIMWVSLRFNQHDDLLWRNLTNSFKGCYL